MDTAKFFSAAEHEPTTLSPSGLLNRIDDASTTGAVGSRVLDAVQTKRAAAGHLLFKTSTNTFTKMGNDEAKHNIDNTAGAAAATTSYHSSIDGNAQRANRAENSEYTMVNEADGSGSARPPSSFVLKPHHDPRSTSTGEEQNFGSGLAPRPTRIIEKISQSKLTNHTIEFSQSGSSPKAVRGGVSELSPPAPRLATEPNVAVPPEIRQGAETSCETYSSRNTGMKSNFGEYMTDAEIKAQRLVDNYRRRQANLAAAKLAKRVERKALERGREKKALKRRVAHMNRLMGQKGEENKHHTRSRASSTSSDFRSTADSAPNRQSEVDSRNRYESASSSSSSSIPKANNQIGGERRRSSYDTRQHARQRRKSNEANSPKEDENSSFPSLDEIFLTQLENDEKTTKQTSSLYNPALYSKTKPKGRYPVTKRILRMNLCLASDNYPVIPRVCKLMGWKRAKETADGDDVAGDWAIAWRDTGAVSVTTVRELINGHAYRKINHFPGMGEICLKHCLAHHMNRIRKSFPKLYKHVPRSWVLPVDKASLTDFLNVTRKGKTTTLICKPTHMCQGRGIYLTRKMPNFEPDPNEDSAASKMLVVQQYITKPLLINDYKFDLRIYVAVTSCSPHLRAFIHREGLTRFCTTPYQAPSAKNIDCAFMHLTNYAVNKKNTDFVQPSVEQESNAGVEDEEEDSDNPKNPEETSQNGEFSNGSSDEESDRLHSSNKMHGHHHGAAYDFSDLPRMQCGLTPEEAKTLLHAQNGSKWSITAMFAHLAERGHDTHAVWNKIKDLVALTLLPISNMLQHRYRASFSSNDDGFGCFELLGFDVMLDHKLAPHLIEVNHSPSFETASPLDDVIKTTVIRDTLRLAGIDADTLLRTARAHIKVSDDSPAKGWNKNESSASINGDNINESPTQNGKKIKTKSGSRQTMLNHSGAHGARTDQKSADVSSGTSSTRGRRKRDEHESLFLEQLRTAYELAHLGGFERVVPLPPNVDPTTRDDPKLRKKWELFQQVGKVETSLNRSSKTHQIRLAEVQRKKREREEKQSKLLRMMRDNEGSALSDYSQRRQSTDDGEDNVRKVIGASSRLYPGPDHQRAQQAKIMQQRKAMAEAAAARIHQGPHFPAVPPNKVALQPTVATLMMPMSLTARRNLGGRVPTLRKVGESLLNVRSMGHNYQSQKQSQAQAHALFLAKQQAQAQAQHQFWNNLAGDDMFLDQRQTQSGDLPLQPRHANYRHAVNPRKHLNWQSQSQSNHVALTSSQGQGIAQRDQTNQHLKHYTTLASQAGAPEHAPLQEQHLQPKSFAEHFYPRAKMMRGTMLSQNKNHSIEPTWRPMGT